MQTVIIWKRCSPGMPPSRVTQMGNGGAYANSWSSESLLREQHSGWVHHHSQWIINFDWPLSKPKCNKWLQDHNSSITKSLSDSFQSEQHLLNTTSSIFAHHRLPSSGGNHCSFQHKIKNYGVSTCLSSTSQQWPCLHALWCMQGNPSTLHGGHYHYMKQLFLK